MELKRIEVASEHRNEWEEVPAEFACPKCGERRMDYLLNNEGDITCESCGYEYSLNSLEWKFAKFVKDNEVTISVSYGAPENPEFMDADGWTVTLEMAGRRMTTHFYKGYGHQGKEPTAEEVLECLVLDAAIENLSYEEWCAEYGYDSDSWRAEKIYAECLKQTEELRKFLGDKFYDLVEKGGVDIG